MARVTTEDLGHDIASAIPAEAVRRYKPTGEFADSQLSFEVGDLVWVLEQHESGWWGGFKDGDTAMGWFPKAVVRLKQTSQRPDSAVCTTDARAVASPMGSRRVSAVEARLQEQVAKLTEEKRKLEEDLDAERRKFSQDLRDAEAKHATLLRQMAEVSSNLERLKRDCARADTGRGDAEAEVQRLREELRRKEEQVEQLQQHSQQLQQQGQQQGQQLQQAQHMQQQQHQQLQQQCQHLQAQCQQLQHQNHLLQQQQQQQQQLQQHAQPSGYRTPSVEVSRRLFSAEDSRTPPLPMHQMGSTGSVGPSVSVSSMPAIPALPSGGQPGSARQAVYSRPSPRAAASAAPGMAWVQQGSAPPSPHNMSRFCGTAPACEGLGMQPVRSLVSQFERRSDPHVAPRMQDPSPQRHFVPVLSGTTRVRAAGAASSRAGSREVPVTRTASARYADAEAPSPEEHPAGFNFGMSPMHRQVHTQPLSGRATGVASASPSAQPSVSVQDRVRQWNGGFAR